MLEIPGSHAPSLSFPERVAHQVLKRPVVGIGFLVLTLLFGLTLLPFLRNESGVQVFADPRSPHKAVLDEVNAQFVNDDLLFIAYEAEDIFSTESLELVRSLGDTMLDLRAPRAVGGVGEVLVEDVTSLATVKELVGADLVFRTVDLVADPVPQDEESLAWIRERAKNNPLMAEQMFTSDGRSGLIIVRVAEDLDDDVLAYTVREIRRVLRETESREEMRLFLAGEIAVNADIARYQQEDLARFIPLVYLIITVMLFVFLRKIRGVLLALLCISVAMISAMGLLVAVGGSMTNTTVMLPPIILTLSVAMLVHYFSEYGKNDAAGRAPVAQRTLAELIPPVFIAAFTTSIAMACLAISKTPAVRMFGHSASLALLLCFLICVFFCGVTWRRWQAPALVSNRGLALSTGFDAFLTSFARLIIRRRLPVFVGSLVLLAAVGAGAARLVVDQSAMAMFSESAPIKKATGFVDDHFGGVTTLVASIRAPKEGYFLEPEALDGLEEVKDFFLNDLGASFVTAPQDYVKLMHREFLDGDPSMYRIPESKEQTEQLLLLNGDDTVAEYINESRSWVRIVARTTEDSTVGLASAHERLEQFLAEQYPSAKGYVTHSTGQSRLSATMLKELLRTQIGSLGLSFVVILALMILLFRSLRAALFSVLPNCFPILIALGVMGWAGIRLDAATVMISTIALGIAIDDTVHFLSHLRRGLASHGDLERGIIDTMRVKGPAIIGTSLIISAGFAVMLVSNFMPTKDFAIMICVAMMAALVGDLVLLPSMALVTKSRLGVRLPEASRSTVAETDAGSCAGPSIEGEAA